MCVREVSGQTSTREITAKQADQVARLMERQIGEALPGRRTTRQDRSQVENGEEIVTKAQSKALLDIARALGWTRGGLHKWIAEHMKNVCGGANWPQTRDQAIAVHEGLEAQLWRHQRNQPERIVERARTALELDVTVWERTFLLSLVERRGQVRNVPTEGDNAKTRASWKSLVKLAEIERKRGGRR